MATPGSIERGWPTNPRPQNASPMLIKHWTASPMLIGIGRQSNANLRLDASPMASWGRGFVGHPFDH